MRWSRRSVALRLGLLFAVLVLMAPAPAPRPGGFRPMPGMGGGRMMPTPNGTMTNPFSVRTPGLGGSQTGFRPTALSRPGYGGSAASSVQGRYSPGSSAAGAGGGYAGGGGGSGGSGSPPTGAGGNPAGGRADPYADLYDRYAAAQGPPPNAGAGPLAGLLNAEGGLDWPLALRILPPGLQTRDLRAQLDARAEEVRRQAASGRVDPDLLRQASRAVDRLGGILADRGDTLPVSGQATTDARQFLRDLRDALKTAP